MALTAKDLTVDLVRSWGAYFDASGELSLRKLCEEWLDAEPADQLLLGITIAAAASEHCRA